jgi:SAM-dependent methyltransferase
VVKEKPMPEEGVRPGDPDEPAQRLFDTQAAHWVRQAPQCLTDFTARPAVLALCEPVAGLCVLDLGCGEGYGARALRRRGAREVLGLDLSAGMIRAAQAQEQQAPLGIDYLQGDAVDLSRWARQTFDLVLSLFMFHYLDLARLTTCLGEVARVLRPGGRLVFVVPHPLLPYLRPPAPPYYFAAGPQGYFSARDHCFPGQLWRCDGTPLAVQVRHKTVEDYFQALHTAGFRSLPVVRELHVTPEILARDPAFFGPVCEVPLHLALALTR